MRARHQALTALTALAVLAGVAMPSFSAATFTSSSASTGTVRAASDWTPPTVELSPPAGSDPFGDEGYVLSGTVVLQAHAADGESEIAALAIQVRGTGAGEWTDVCSVTGPAATCAWDTTRAADGAYDVRARARDGAGYQSTSTVLTATVRNHVGVQLTSLPAYVRGSVPLTAAVSGTGGSTYPVEIQYRTAGTPGTWQSACSGTACAWQTSGLAPGSYELRARVVAGGSVLATSAPVTTIVDNAAPQVVMTDPGTPLKGTVTFAASVTDGHSGVASMTLFAQRSDGSAATSLCTLTSAPYACPFDTRQLADGAYSFYAVARDRAGNEATSPAVTNRVIGNVVQTLKGIDVQAVNGGPKPGYIDQGDVITYDFNEPVATGSLLSGWDGTQRAVTVTVGPGTTNTDNLLQVGNVNLGGLRLTGGHLPGNTVMTFPAQVTASTHQGGTRITVVLTGSSGLQQQKTVNEAGTLVWSPSATIRTPGQGTILPGTVPESGALDTDF